MAVYSTIYRLVSFAPTTGVASTHCFSPLHPHTSTFCLKRSDPHTTQCIALHSIFYILTYTHIPSLLAIIVPGLANITIQFKVHSGWKSLVTVGSIKGELSIAKVIMFRFGSITQSVLFYPHDPVSVEVCLHA